MCVCVCTQNNHKLLIHVSTYNTHDVQVCTVYLHLETLTSHSILDSLSEREREGGGKYDMLPLFFTLWRILVCFDFVFFPLLRVTLTYGSLGETTMSSTMSPLL